MIYGNIYLGSDVNIDPTTSINQVKIGNGTKIAKRCSIYGSAEHPLEIGENSYIGMNTILNGYTASLKIGHHVSIAQNVNVMVDSAPNASELMQRIFPCQVAPVTIGNHCWIGASVVILPGVTLGDFCVVATNSVVKTSFPPYSIIGGTPAKLIRKMNEEEIQKLQ